MATPTSLLQNIVDVEVEECTIYSPTQPTPLNLYPSLLGINYYEDLFSNCITGNVIINDANGYSTTYSWHGEEYISLSFRRNNQVDWTRGKFKVYSLSDRKLGNDTSEMYVLNFCSEEMLLNEKLRINKTYKETPISSMVEDIAINYLKIKKPIFTEKTYGKYNITIPNLNPLQAINWLCNIAISDSLPGAANGDSGATYLFWETKSGYFFKSVLSLLHDSNNIYRGIHNAGFYWYGTKNADTNEMLGAKLNTGADRPDKAQQIFTYDAINSYNSLDSLKKGMFSNKTISLDLIGRNKQDHKFDYNKYFDYLKNNISLYKTEGKFPILSGSPDRFNNTDEKYDNVNIRIFHTTTGQNANAFISDNEKGVKDYKIEKCISYRAAQFALLSHNKLKIVIPGDNILTAGMIIKVYIPSTYINTKTKTNMENKFLSGYYLITALRHSINSIGDFRSILELRKDSYYSISGVDNSNPGINVEILTPDILKTFSSF